MPRVKADAEGDGAPFLQQGRGEEILITDGEADDGSSVLFGRAWVGVEGDEHGLIVEWLIRLGVEPVLSEYYHFIFRRGLRGLHG